jgi:hypothetical protein
MMEMRRSAAPSPRPPSLGALHLNTFKTATTSACGAGFFSKTDNSAVRGSAICEDVPHCATQAVVTGECADAFTHRAAGLLCAETFAATVKCEFQQIAAFQCVKHCLLSDTAWEKSAQKMVNIPLTGRTMEVRHA